jgi:hypothetical protein
MREFKPAADYQLLLQQAKALFRSVEFLEEANMVLERRNRELEKQIALANSAEIDALRGTIEKLTNELER